MREETRSSLDLKSLLKKNNALHSVFDYARNQTVYFEDDVADCVYYIQSGVANATVVSEQGKEAVVDIFGPRDFFGQGCLTALTRRTSTISTITECVIAQISKLEFLRILQDEPAFSRSFVAYLSGRNIQMQQNIANQMLNSSEKRLVRILILLESYNGDNNTKLILSKISQEMLAEMVGTTRSRVNYFLNKFRKLGIADYSRDTRVDGSLIKVIQRSETARREAHQSERC